MGNLMKSLRSKIIVFIILVSVYPMLLMGIIASYNYDNIIKERFISSARMNMSHIATSINSDIGDMGKSIINMLQDPTFYDTVYNQPNVELGSFDSFNIMRDIKDYLSTIVFAKKNYDIGGLYFYGNEQHIFYSQEVGLAQEKTIPVEAMVANISGYKGYKFYYESVEQSIHIYLTQQVYNNDTLKPIGMIYYRVDPDYLLNIFESTFSEDGVTMFLYTEDGVMIAREGSLSVESIIQDNQYYSQDVGVYVNNDRTEEYYVINEKVNELNLEVLTVVSSNVLTQDSRKVMDLVFILYMASIPIIIIAAYFLNGNIVKPVHYLIDRMKTFEEGRFDVRIDQEREDEFGYLYHAFNEMTSNINTLVNDVYIKELARKDAEIASLQEQINPHFLYNTLESINWRAQLAGEQEIALMIQALSKLMDGNINRDNEKFIRMEQEVNYMEQYMFLVKMRYEDELEFDISIDEAVKDAYVPKLIIQPLLENSVKHGIEAKGGGRIDLKCFMENDKLVIIVKDTGQGMSPYVEQRIRELIELENRNINIQKDKRQSIGFQNVARRIHLIYGNEADIQVYSKEEIGTTITLILPYQNQKQRDIGGPKDEV